MESALCTFARRGSTDSAGTGPGKSDVGMHTMTKLIEYPRTLESKNLDDGRLEVLFESTLAAPAIKTYMTARRIG